MLSKTLPKTELNEDQMKDNNWVHTRPFSIPVLFSNQKLSRAPCNSSTDDEYRYSFTVK